MECNKEEAIRAKEIAEIKMQSRDFEGAKKFVLKAQRLFPELENISQLMTVCDVHCAAGKKVNGSEMDWYGILQVDNKADEVTIKKQYRKLAILIHPDKNKFTGAEAAFKMIGEANMVLSDRDKRSLYDMKCRAPVKTTAAPRPPPRHQVHTNSNLRNQGVGLNSFPTAPKPQFAGLNPHQQFHLRSQKVDGTFWTSCPFCNMRYQYHIDVINKNLRCPNCTKVYIAHDMGPGPQGVASFANLKHPNSIHQKVSQVGSRSYTGTPVFPTGFPVNLTSKTAGAVPVTKPGSSNDISGMPQTKREGNQHVDVGRGEKFVGRSEYDAAKGRGSAARNTSRKRGGKQRVESSESLDTSSSDEAEDVIEENVSNYDGKGNGSNGGGECRRSSRQKRRVTYNELLSDDDDFESPPKRSRESGSSSSTEDEIFTTAPVDDGGASDNLADSQKANAIHEESLPNGKRKVELGDDDGVKCGPNTETSKVEEYSESGLNGASENYEYPDPEFSDFDKLKAENCFDVNQVWAIYDTTDAMPRYYALIKKTSSSRFKLHIAWLEANPTDHADGEWVFKGLPVSCGKFKTGSSDVVTDILSFSHRVHFEKSSSRRDTFVIYPRKGETWALFKDWDVKWTNDPKRCKPFNYEVVSIVSDFDQDDGIEVAYLSRVRGFVCLFQQTTRYCQIPTSELLKFSHKIPSFRMTGNEREGVPVGSFELDAVSLPRDLDQFYDQTDTKMNNYNDGEIKNSCPNSPSRNVKLKVDTEMTETPRKHENTDPDKEVLRPRRSPQESKGVNKKQNIVTSNQCQAKSHDNDRNTKARPFDFSERKTDDKFIPGQIWAMYSDKERLPIRYAMIRRVQQIPDFVLDIVLLEPFSPTKGVITCGTFKLQSGKVLAAKREAFSHLVNADHGGRGTRFIIYPKKGEVWAIYKNWNIESRCSDPKQEYEIVEIVDQNDLCTKVSVLVSVNGSKSVYHNPKKQEANGGIIDIPRVELPRFSHQIPAFWHSGEKDEHLKDCWQLDPSSIPGTIICLD